MVRLKCVELIVSDVKEISEHVLRELNEHIPIFISEELWYGISISVSLKTNIE